MFFSTHFKRVLTIFYKIALRVKFLAFESNKLYHNIKKYLKIFGVFFIDLKSASSDKIYCSKCSRRKWICAEIK